MHLSPSRLLLPLLAATCATAFLPAQNDTAPHPDVREIRVPGDAAIARVWTEADAVGRAVPHYSLSLDGETFTAPNATSYDLQLRFAVRDPLAGIDVPANLRAIDTRLAIVQFWTQRIDAYAAVLARLGAEERLFLPHHAQVVSIPPGMVEAVRTLPFVRAVLPFHPAFKLERALREAVRAHDHGRVRVNLLTTRRGRIDQDPVSRWVQGHGGVVDHVSEQTHLMTVTVDVAQLPALAALDHVQWIDRWTPAENDMDIARAFHGANYVETNLGYTGQGVRVEVMDGGCELIHPDIQNFVVHSPNNTPSSHGTSCSGIVLGSGAGDPQARGVIPDALLVIADYNSYAGGSRYNHSVELQDPSGAYKCVLQSNSWGNSRTRSYTSVSSDMDLILFDLQKLSITQSQSNAGNQDSRPQAWAKNIIAVGGVRHYNTLSKSDDRWNGSASIGPAADGRIKPDLASFYDSTYCTDRVGNNGYSSGNYTSFGGTSGATPIVAGHLGLFYQMWHNGVFGNSAPGAEVFDNRPNNTTAKAMLINTASQWTFSGTNHDLTRVHQGWGHPDMQRMLDLAAETYVVDESDVLTNLSSTVHSLTVNGSTPALKATMVYRDPPGTTSSNLHRINDLDLKVTSPSGTVYWGNNGLLGGMWSTSGGSPNSVDTVENVFVQNPQAGTWLVEVIAAEINQDSHVETGATDADYALVVTGVDPNPAPPVADFTGTPTSGTEPLVVTFADQSTGNPGSWSWSFGDGSTSTAQNPVHTYTAPGTYTVSMTATNSQGSDTKVRTGYVTVNPGVPPVAAFIAGPTSGKASLTVNFSDQSTGNPTSWAWSFGDGGTSTAQNPVHVYTTPGAYSVTLVVTNTFGTDTLTRSAYINVDPGDPPVAAFSGTPTSGTAPLAVNFTDQSTNTPTSWSWSFGDGGTSTAQNPAHVYASPGTYTVSLTATNAWGTDTTTATNFVNVVMGYTGEGYILSRNSDFSTDDRVFDRSETIYMLLWSDNIDFTDMRKAEWEMKDADRKRVKQNLTNNNDNTFTTSFTLANLPSSSTSWTWKGKLEDNNRRKFQVDDQVTVNPAPIAPTADFTGTPISGTAPLTVNFTDQSTGNANAWSWDFGDGNTSTAQNPTHTYTATGIYTVTLTASNAAGADTRVRNGYITVAQPAPPTAAFTGTPTSGSAPLTVSFTDQSTGTPTSWSWDFGDGGTSSAQSPSHTYTTPGTYTVTMVVSNGMGTDTLTRTDYVTVNQGYNGQGFILSKNPDFSTNDRVFSRSDTIYMLMWSDTVDFTNMRRAEWELKGSDKSKVRQNLTNSMDNSFTASFTLANLPSSVTSWEWKGKIEDNNRKKFQVRERITVNP